MLNQIEGDTPLHHAIREAINLEDFTNRLSKISGGTLSVSLMTRTTNDEGKIPIELLEESPLVCAEKNKLFHVLISLMTDYSVKPLSEKISARETLNRYDLSSKSELYKNLTIACEIANETREAIRVSSTHPQLNLTPVVEQTVVRERINALRAESPDCSYSTKNILIALSMNPLALAYNTQDTLFKKWSDIILSRKVGNCGEMSIVAYDKLRTKHGSLNAKVLQIINGDHCILVFGQERDAVVCDPWFGDCYPLTELANRASAFVSLPSFDGSSLINITKIYNPKIHFLHPMAPVSSALRVYGISMSILIGAIGLFAISKIADRCSFQEGTKLPSMLL